MHLSLFKIKILFYSFIYNTYIIYFLTQGPKKNSQGILLISGGVAGVVSRTCTAPMDRIKVLLQVSPDVGNKSIQVTGVRQGVQAIYKDGGWKAFFRGNATNVIKTIPESAARYWMYENMKHILSNRDMGDISLVSRFIAGSSAGLFAQFLVYPLEVVKTRLAVAPTGFYTSIFTTMERIAKHEGIYIYIYILVTMKI